MKSLDESIVTALDGSDPELLPYLPYILQDLWELGASPEVVIKLIRKHVLHPSSLRILDLGCGKGAVSIKMAAAFQCRCLGVDAFAPFIEEARLKAREYGVEAHCRFECADIRTRVWDENGFDWIILGSIGPVLGDYYDTLTSLARYLRPQGKIIMDDGYIEDDHSFSHPLIQKRSVVLRQIARAGMKLIAEVIIDKEAIEAADAFIFEKIDKRCRELMGRYPARRDLFLSYIKDQERENEVLETKVACSTMVLGQI